MKNGPEILNIPGRFFIDQSATDLFFGSLYLISHFIN